MSSRSSFGAALAVLALAWTAASAAQAPPAPIELETAPPAEATPAIEEPDPATAIELEPGAPRPAAAQRDSTAGGVAAVLVTTAAAHDDGAPRSSQRDLGTVGEDDPAVYFARATLVLDRKPTELSHFNLAYEGEGERYGEGAELDAVNHSLGFLVENRPGRHTHWALGGSLLDGEDPGRFLSGLVTLLPRGPYRQTRLYTSLDHLFRASTVGIHFGGLRTELESPAGVEQPPLDGTETPAELHARLPTDDTELYGALTFDHAVGPRSALSFGYSYIRPDADPFLVFDPLFPLAPPTVAVREPFHAATVGIAVRTSADLSFLVSVGAAGDSEESTGIGSLEVRKQGAISHLRVRYDRTLAVLGSQPAVVSAPTPVESGLPQSVAQDSVTQTLSLAVEIDFGDRWQWEQSAWITRTDVPGADSLDTAGLSGRAVYRLVERVGLFGELDYFDQSGVTGFESNRTRLGIGLIFGLGSPGGERGLLAQRTSALRVLPNRGGT